MRIRMRTVTSIEHLRFGVMNEEKDLTVTGRPRFDIV
jgi:hypothetical protein